VADVEFRIGGKDDTGKAIASATKGLSRLELSFGQIVKAAGGFAAVNASINLVSRGFSNLAGLVGQGVADFDKATEAQRALTKAMELNGGATDEQVAKQMSLADALERTTNVEAETTAELMKSAAMLGVQNDQLGEVAKTAIGLSEAMGVSLEDGLKKARLATEGNFSSFNKLIPSLKDMATNEERLAAVMSLANKGLEQKTGQADGAAGAYERMSNRVGNMMEKIGEAISPFRKLAFDGIGFAADKITEAIIPAIAAMGPIIESAQGWLESFRQFVVFMVNSAITSFTFWEVVIGNFGTVIEMMVASAQLQFERLVETIKHALTVQIPAYASWFAGNFTKLMTDAFNATVTIASNLGTKIASILSRIWEFVSSGMSGGFDKLSEDIGKLAAGSLLEGFKATADELPEIAARAMTDREKELTERLGSLGSKIGDEFNKKLSGRLIGTEEAVTSVSKAVLSSAGGGSAQDKKASDAVSEMLGGGGSGTGGGGGALQATSGRLLSRGPGSDIPDLLRQMIDATKSVGAIAQIQADSAAAAQSQAAQNAAAITSALSKAPTLAPALQ
jgi:hypothetical protein